MDVLYYLEFDEEAIFYGCSSESPVADLIWSLCPCFFLLDLLRDFFSNSFPCILLDLHKVHMNPMSFFFFQGKTTQQQSIMIFQTLNGALKEYLVFGTFPAGLRYFFAIRNNFYVMYAF